MESENEKPNRITPQKMFEYQFGKLKTAVTLVAIKRPTLRTVSSKQARAFGEALAKCKDEPDMTSLVEKDYVGALAFLSMAKFLSPIPNDKYDSMRRLVGQGPYAFLSAVGLMRIDEILMGKGTQK